MSKKISYRRKYLADGDGVLTDHRDDNEMNK